MNVVSANKYNCMYDLDSETYILMVMLKWCLRTTCSGGVDREAST